MGKGGHREGGEGSHVDAKEERNDTDDIEVRDSGITRSPRLAECHTARTDALGEKTVFTKHPAKKKRLSPLWIVSGMDQSGDCCPRSSAMRGR